MVHRSSHCCYYRQAAESFPNAASKDSDWARMPAKRFVQHERPDKALYCDELTAKQNN